MVAGNQTEEIRQRVNIVDIVSEYVHLKKAGKNYLGLCPFHTEKTPSFTVSEEKQIFHCFGCGVGGDVFSFLMRYENATFYDALETLAQKAGIELRQGGQEKVGIIQDLYKINERAMEFYHEYLMKSTEAEGVRKYLKKRGIDRETVREFKIGYAERSGKGLANYLRRHQFSLELAREAGLVNIKGKIPYDLFRNRILFPIFDVKNRVIGFGGRIFGEGMPKYLNTPESLLFRKREALYGLNLSKNHLLKKGLVLVVEGYMDLISLYRHGIKNIVATLGTALTGEHIKRIKRYVKTVYPLFDSDEAGIKAALRSFELFLKEDIEARVVLLPEGSDPDEFITKEGKEGMNDAINRAMPIIDFYIKELIKGRDLKDPDKKLSIIEEVSKKMAIINNPVKRGLYIKRVSEALKIDESLIYMAVGRAQKREKRGIKKETATLRRIYRAEDVIIWGVLNHSDLLQGDLDSIIEDLEEEELRKIGRFAIEKHGKGADITSLMDTLGDEKLKARMTRIALSYEGLERETLIKIINDCIKRIKLKKLKKEKDHLILEIKEAERKNRTDLLYKLLKRKQELMVIERSHDAILNYK